MHALALLLSLVSAARGAETVRLDPRVELTAAIHLLASDAPEFSRTGRYAEELKRLIAPFASHPVVAAHRALEAKHFPSGGFLFLLYQRLDPKTLKPAGQEPLATPPIADADARAYVAAAADFAAKAKLLEWLAAKRPLYADGLAKARADLARLDLRSRLEKYAGAPTRVRSVVVISPLYKDQASAFITDENKFTALSVFGYADFDKLSPFIWQEMAHSALDHLAREHALDAVRLPESHVNRCGEKVNCVAEMIARGVAMHLYLTAHPGATLDPRFIRAGSPSYKIEAALAEYDRDRAKHKTLAAYYPRLLEALRD